MYIVIFDLKCLFYINDSYAYYSTLHCDIYSSFIQLYFQIHKTIQYVTVQ